MPGESADGRWLSYSELAEIRGIDVRSAIRTVRNRRWSKQRGNDGKIRVLVPTEFLDGRRRDPPEIPSEIRTEIPPEITAKISRLEAKVEALTEQRDKAEARVSELTEQVTELRVREGAAMARADELRGVVDRLTAWPGAAAWARLQRVWRR